MKKLFPFLCMATVTLTACQQLNETVFNESEEQDEKKVSIVAAIGKQQQSRTVMDNQDNTVFSFCEDDEIGVFADGAADTYKWKLTNTEGQLKWQPETSMKWPEEEIDQMVTFFAYSPYTGEMSENKVEMPSLLGQTGDAKDLAKYDFLVARCTNNYMKSGGEIFFTGDNAFQHVSSLIAFKVKNDPNMSGAIIQKILFKGNGVATQTKYVFSNTEELTIEASPAADIVNKMELTVNQTVAEEGAVFYTIVNPVSSDLSLSLSYTRNGILYETKEVKLGTDFTSNNMYKYSLSINKGEVIITGADIDPWESNEMGDITLDEVKKEETK
ncbi:MAG: fimbrillin family protein [Bacteroidales bacterium]|nr:fimbrillin family protein [Bacteroidales bacterium]